MLRQLDRYGLTVISVLRPPGTMKTYEEHSIDVMHITVFPSAVVDVILGHSDLWAVEDRGLESSLRHLIDSTR